MSTFYVDVKYDKTGFEEHLFVHCSIIIAFIFKYNLNIRHITGRYRVETCILL